MRAIGVAVIFIGLAISVIYVAIYSIVDSGRRLAKKESRPQAVKEIKQGAKSTSKVVGGALLYYLFLFGGIFILLVVIYGLGLG